jgi:hypothetical protein
MQKPPRPHPPLLHLLLHYQPAAAAKDRWADWAPRPQLAPTSCEQAAPGIGLANLLYFTYFFTTFSLLFLREGFKARQRLHSLAPQ